MPTFPLATLSAQITATGITAPPYSDILSSLQASFQVIYGSDIYIAADSQDGQFLALIAAAINDNNQAMIAVYQGYSPTYAQGAGLSAQVKLNGLQRLVASKSTAVGTATGQAGSVITAGVVKDSNGNLWNLPSTVTIPIGGSISVTVTAQQAGAIQAGIGTINIINSVQLGWQSFTNTAAAVVGNPVETDAQLRIRQSISTALPALSNLDSIRAAIGNVAGVQRFTVYENPTAATDANGIPAHSIAPVVSGGSVADIAQAIAARKPPGIQTFGPTSYTYYDVVGMPVPINFKVLDIVPVYVSVNMTALPGYTAATGTLVINAVVAAINALVIGEDVYLNRLFAPASLAGEAASISSGLLPFELYSLSETFHVTSILVGLSAGTKAASDLVIAYNAAASAVSTNLVLTVT
jgi:uncharacterized phage protein gp47/JayE